SLSLYGVPRHTHSFPTRRSSDLSTSGCHLPFLISYPRVLLGQELAPSLNCRVQAGESARSWGGCSASRADGQARGQTIKRGAERDRKSTRLNSSHVANSYAVFCL